MATEEVLPVLPPAMLKESLLHRKALYGGWRGMPMTGPQHGEVLRMGHLLFTNERGPVQHLKLLTLVRFLFGRSSTKDLDKAEASAFIGWARMKDWPVDIASERRRGPPPPDPRSIQEAAAVIALNDEQEGQLRLPLG